MAVPVLPPTGDIGSYARLALGAVATAVATNGANYLVAHNLITSAQTADFVSWGSGVIIAGAAVLWARIKNLHFANKLNAAAATGDPNADPKAPAAVAAVQAAIADPSSPIVAKEPS